MNYEEKKVTIDKEIDDLRAKFEKSKESEKLEMLDEINAYVEELEKVYSSA